MLQLVDSRIGPTEDDRMMLRYLANTGLPYMVVATKADKLNATERRACELSLASDPDILPDTPIVFTSTLKNEGKTAIWSKIAEFTGVKL